MNPSITPMRRTVRLARQAAALISSLTLAFVPITACLLTASAAIGAQVHTPSRPLFVDVPRPAVAIERKTTVARHRSVTVDVANVRAQKSVGARLRLNLFSGEEFEGVVDQVITRDLDDFSLVGSLEGHPHSSFTLVCKDGITVMNARTDKATYQLRYIGNSFYEVRQIDESKFPPCATLEKHGVAAAPEVPPAKADATAPAKDFSAADSAAFIDVLVVYTPASRSAAGGTAAMAALINLAVDESNVAYQQSQITTRLRLVHQQEVAYTESGTFDADLSRLTSTSDGYLDEVHQLRNTHGADVVTMLINNNQYCGLAWVMTSLSSGFASSAFNTVAWDCAVGNYSFAHEIGHNQGCEHDRANAGTGLNPYSYGWRFTGTNGAQYRSIMAYSPGTRIPRFSNPNVLYFGTPTGMPVGDAQAAYNALTINNSAPTIANFRQSVIGCTNTSVSPALADVSYGAGTGSVTVNASSNCSWTAVSGSPFITISGGGSGTGNGSFNYSFSANPSTVARTGTVGVAAQTFTLVQAGAPSLADVLDTPGRVWTTGGNLPWIVQNSTTYDGVDAAQGGSITRSQQTYVETSVIGPANVSYWWKVSSEPGGDLFRMSVNGAVSNQISGEVNWQQITLALPSGTHAVRWTYSKNNNVNAGTDSAWLDQVVVSAPSQPHHLVLVAGDNQTASAGGTLPVNPAVRVVDSANIPIGGVPVTFTVQSGGGSVGSTSVVSSANGIASTPFTLGVLAGTNRLTATAALPGSPSSIPFVATGVPGPAYRVALHVQPASLATAGVTFARQPVVRVEDQFGNLRTNDNTTVINAARSAGSGSLQGTTSSMTVGGLAAFGNLSHTVATNITIAFTGAGLLSTTSAAVTIVPGTASRLHLVRQPSNIATAGVSFAQQPLLHVQDAFGNQVTNANAGTVLAESDNGIGTLQGTTTAQPNNGIISFANLAHHVAESIRIRFTLAGLSGATSEVVNIVAGPFTQLQTLVPGEVASLGAPGGKTGTPSSQTVNVPFTLQVNAVDAYWNRVTNVTDIVSVTSSDAGASLPANASLVNGAREFSAVFKSAGPQTVTSSDVTDVSKSPGTSSVISVLQGSQSITFGSLPAKSYGDAPFAISATASSGLPVSFEVVSGPAQIAGELLTITGAGSVDLRASQAGDQNWNAASNVQQTLQVLPAELVVVSDNQSRPYGATNPPFTGTSLGIVNGDNITATFSTTATVESPVGEYPITPFLNDPGNRLGHYRVLSTNGSLTIVQGATTGQLSSSANPALPGSEISFTYSVNIPQSDTVFADGLVQFKVAETNFSDPVPLSNGVAQITLATLEHGQHSIAAEFLGTTNLIGATNELFPNQVINSPPSAGTDTIVRIGTNAAKVTIATLMANDRDTDGDFLTLSWCVAASTNGATITQSNGWIHYLPPSGTTNTDMFNYTIEDVFGSTASGMVHVEWVDESVFPEKLQIARLESDSYQIQLSGVPGRSYNIEWADNLQTPEWQLLTNATPSQGGSFETIDVPPPGTSARFYRMIQP